MNRKIFFLTFLFLPATLACTITLLDTPAAPPPAPQVITQIVVVPADTTAPLPTLAPPTATLESAPPVQPTITFTFTPSATSTPSGTVATLIKDAFCRKGPATTFVIITGLTKGQVAQIVGRNPDLNNTWWLVIVPGTNVKCWISFVTAQATGDFDSIPIIHPPY